MLSRFAKKLEISSFSTCWSRFVKKLEISSFLKFGDLENPEKVENWGPLQKPLHSQFDRSWGFQSTLEKTRFVPSPTSLFLVATFGFDSQFCPGFLETAF